MAHPMATAPIHSPVETSTSVNSRTANGGTALNTTVKGTPLEPIQREKARGYEETVIDEDTGEEDSFGGLQNAIDEFPDTAIH